MSDPTQPAPAPKPGYAKQPKTFVERTPMQFAKREMHRQLTDKRFWLIYGAVVLVLVVAGPFGTADDKDWLGLLGYWSITAFSTYVACFFASAWGSEILSRSAVKYPASQLIAAIPAGGAAWLCVVVISHFAGFTNPPDPLGLLLQCVLVSLAINVMYIALRNDPPSQDTVDPEKTSQRLVLDKLSPANRGEIIHIETQDHYLSVTTTAGREMILMRFSDAVTALGDSGFQTHRSHWISRNHVIGSKRENNRWVVELSNTTSVPVSRTFLATLREAGVIK